MQIRNLLGSSNFLPAYKTSKARVCVTVGMMTTGYDCPDILKNVALIKFPKGCQVDNRFLKDVLDSAAMQDRFQRQATGSTQKFIPLGFIRNLAIPLPPLATQQAVVAEIEAEQALVAGNRELITRFEEKIQATLARIWGEGSKPA